MNNSYVVKVLLAVLCGLSPRLSEAATYYWDVDGTTPGFSTVVGTWNTANNFWNTDSTGGAGTPINTTTAADDLIFKQAAINTGSITVSGTQLASSITFAPNIGPTATITGGAINIGGTGASSGVFQQSSGANTISTTLTLKSDVSAFNFSNSSSGLLTIGAVTGAATTGTQTITVGSSSSGGITCNGIIGNGGAGGKVGLTMNNTSTGVTTLSGNNTYTGNILISAGTVKAELRQTTANPASGALGNAQTVGRTLTISSGATLDFTKNDELGNENSTPNLTIIANGGTIKNTSSAPFDQSGFNRLGPVQLNGGTLSSTSGGYGDGYWAYPGFALGTVTVGGSAVSTISTIGNYNSGFTGSPAGIGLQTAANGSTTFDVTDAVSGSDLNVTGVLQNWGTNFPNNPGALIKTGIGTMTLSGANTYSGTTTISAGTLQFAKQVSLYNNISASWTAAKINVKSGATLALNVDSAGTAGFTAANLNTLLTAIYGGTSTSEGLQAGAVLGLDTSTATGGTFTQGNAISNSTGTGGGSLGLTKLGTGTLVMDRANTYSGATTISAGTLALGATNTLPSASAVAISNATLNVATYTNRVGTLTVTGSATINLGAGGKLAFDDSNGSWAGTLTITGTFVSGQSLKFGTTSLGLSAGQLAKISMPGVSTFGVDANGYLVDVVPQGTVYSIR